METYITINIIKIICVWTQFEDLVGLNHSLKLNRFFLKKFVVVDVEVDGQTAVLSKKIT